MVKRIYLLFVLAFCIFAFSKAQTPVSLIYNSQTVVSADTFVPGDTVLYSFIVQNLDTTQSVAATTIIHQKLPPDTVTYILNQSLLTIPPGDTASVVFIESIQTGKYKGGVNVLVIWPDAPSITSVDSIVKEIFYLDTLANIPPGLAGSFDLKIFPRPTKGKVKVSSKAPIQIIKDAILYAPNGQLIRYYDSLPSELDLSHLSNGIYHFAVRLIDGSAVREKILLMK